VCYLPAPMSPAKKTSKRSSTSKKSAATGGSKKTAAKKTAAKKTAAKKTAVKKTTKKDTAKAQTAKKTAAAKTTGNVGSKGAAPKKSVARRTSAPGARPSRAAKPAKLDKRSLDQIRQTLESERDDLLQRQAELEQDSFDATQSDLTGEVGLDEDFADAGTATFERERDLSIRNNIRDLIDQITRAIQRIEEGTYGTCERCGRPIDAARLKALPHALLCMDCKRREERAR
jgi:RNA polymerase-binding transcription factor